tara:strand:- start:5010 stop:5252 length:243 start_codon:yes stop_codon:yes gene_type:complete
MGEREYLSKQWNSNELSNHRKNVVSEIKSLKKQLNEMKTQNEKIILLLGDIISTQNNLNEVKTETLDVTMDRINKGWFFT